MSFLYYSLRKCAEKLDSNSITEFILNYCGVLDLPKRPNELINKDVTYFFVIYRIFWEAYMVVVFVVSMTMLPFNVARNMEHMTMEHQAKMTPTHVVLIICDIFGILDVLLCCFTGYANNTTRKVFLNPRKIFW